MVRDGAARLLTMRVESCVQALATKDTKCSGPIHPHRLTSNKEQERPRGGFQVLPRTRALWVVIAVLCVALLMAPALWNGFPLLQYDTGGYLARWFEGYLVPSRAAAYGLLLVAGAGGNFWPVLIVQCALTVWVVHLLLRAHGYGRPWPMLGVVVA